jgi:transcriptional regulator with XRE-family HTH domain
MATVVHQKRRSPFGNLLREALTETGVSTKELSRRLAPTPGHAEAKRRLLQKYVSGEVSPGPGARASIATALGIDGARFAEDKEHEESLDQILNALVPLADALLDLAVAARRKADG